MSPAKRKTTTPCPPPPDSALELAIGLKQQQDLRNGLVHATQEGRAKIREALQQAREQFLADQRQARGDLKKRLNELKDQLRQQQDIIDNAEQEGKDRTHSRK